MLCVCVCVCVCLYEVIPQIKFYVNIHTHTHIHTCTYMYTLYNFSRDKRVHFSENKTLESVTVGYFDTSTNILFENSA